MSRNDGVQRTDSDDSLDWLVALRGEQGQEGSVAPTATTSATTTTTQHQLQSSFIKRDASRTSSGISFADAVTILNADNSIDEIPFVMSAAAAATTGGGSDAGGDNDVNEDSFPSARSESSLNSLSLDEVLIGGGGAATAATTITNSTSSDSLDSTEKQKQQQVSSADRQDNSKETAKAMAKAGLMAGFMMLLGPMVSKIRSFFAKNDDTDVSLPQQHSITTKTTQQQQQQLMPEQATRSATMDSAKQQQQHYYYNNHQMSQSIAHESSRHLACGVYYADPVKQAVLRQAMISAAQSAGASAAHGAAVLAGTTTAAGMAVGTKLVIAGILVSFLLGGGLVAIATADEKDVKVGGGPSSGSGDDSNGNSGGTGGDSIVSSHCPLGEVLSLDDNSCMPSMSICEPWQQAINGECTECPDGTVSVVDEGGSATHVECEPCPPGSVRSDASGAGEGPCIPAEAFCEPWQHAIDGKCTECPAGQVAVESYDACEVCPAGKVRSHVNGTGLGPCVSASNYCEPWQGATNGKCSDCPVGAVSEIDEATGLPTFERCSYCNPGNVRVQADGIPLGSCVSAVGFCKDYQAAWNGKCEDCGPGEAPSVNADGTPNHEECIFCPRGQVRSSANGLALGPCVPAQGFCQEWEMAAFGRCTTCARGQVSSTKVDGQFTHIDCEFCPRGQVRGSEDGRGAGPCVSAVGICHPNQRATKGQCISCINGLLSSVDANGNYNHMSCV